MRVSEAVEARRAVKHYDADHVMSEEDFRTLMDLALRSPTSFNIQNWRFVRVKDKEKRDAIRAAAWDQAQVTDASELLILCADVKAWNKDPARYWRNAPQETADILVPMIGQFYEEREWMQRDEAMRSVGIAAQTIMLAAQEMGYDTCPMVGFDFDAVSEIIRLPEDHVIGMVVVIGQAAQPAHAHGGDIPYDEAVIENTF